MNGTNPAYVGGQTEVVTDLQGGAYTYDTSYWALHGDMQDGAGDGTVPTSSGAAPLSQGGGAVRQQFKLMGIEHEPAYRDATVQKVVLYSMAKIAGMAKKPA